LEISEAFYESQNGHHEREKDFLREQQLLDQCVSGLSGLGSISYTC